MNLKSQEYNRQFLDALQLGQVYNDASKYGVKIREAQAPGRRAGRLGVSSACITCRRRKTEATTPSLSRR